jgi:hypothetical protein
MGPGRPKQDNGRIGREPSPLQLELDTPTGARGLSCCRRRIWDYSYTLTPAGRELRPIVEAIGTWGIRWIPELGDEDLDPHLLMWDIHRNVALDEVPPGRTILRFTFRDVVGSGHDWWLVISPRVLTSATSIRVARSPRPWIPTCAR